jgi:hypothetical protein
MSPVNLKKKFENFLRLHYWVKALDPYWIWIRIRNPDPYWYPTANSGSGSGSGKNEYGSTTLILKVVYNEKEGVSA